MKKIIMLIVISILVFNISPILNTKTTIKVERKEYLTEATDNGFESEELYRCINDTITQFPELAKSPTTKSLPKLKLLSLTEEDFLSLEYLSCENYNITSTKGIEKLINLKELNLSNNNIIEIDLSQNNSLRNISLGNNQIKSIKLPTSTEKLAGLSLNNNNLSNINISQYTNLEYLELSQNKLKNINIDNNTNLFALDLSYNELTEINLNNNTKIETLKLSFNKIKNINLDNNTNIRELRISNNELTEINLDNNPEINVLDLSYNELTEIDLSKLQQLRSLFIFYNNLSTLDISNSPQLSNVVASFNNLSSLSLNNDAPISSLDISYNKLDNFEIANKEAIQSIAIESNQLETFDETEYPSLNNITINHYKVIPVYGTSIPTKDVIDNLPDNIKVNDYKLYNDFSIDNFNNYDMCNNNYSRSINSSSSSETNSSGNTPISNNKKTNITLVNDEEESTDNSLCTINIYDSDTVETQDESYKRLQLISNNVTVDKLNQNNNLQLLFNGNFEVRFINITSDKYTIDNEKNTIDVDIDNDETILKNIKTSWEETIIKINNGKLQVYYEDKLLKEYTIKRVINPKTGNLINNILAIIGIISALVAVKFSKQTNS